MTSPANPTLPVAKPIGLFAGFSLAVIALTAWVMTLIWSSPLETRAIWTSAAVAFSVQVIAFAIVKLSAKTNVMAGWGRPRRRARLLRRLRARPAATSPPVSTRSYRAPTGRRRPRW